MNDFPVSVPIPIKTGSVRIDGNIAIFNTLHGVIQFDTEKNPVRILDGDMRQGLMRSTDGEWFIETISGGINLLFLRLLHQAYLMKLPPTHELIPANQPIIIA